jgi:hypothetical protein
MRRRLHPGHGVVGDLTPRDDLMHPVGDEASHNESMFFNFFDSERQIGGFVRIGNRPNEGHAEMTFCVFLKDGSVLFQWERPAIDGNAAFNGGGMEFVIEEPGERIALRYTGDTVHLADPLQMSDPAAAMRSNPRMPTELRLTFAAAGPLVGSATGDPHAMIFLAGVGHYQQSGSYEGTLAYGDMRTSVNALGVRDHSWGRRVWHDIYMDRSFWAVVGDNLGFIACKTWNDPEADPDVVGCVIENGAAYRLKAFDLTSRYAAGSARHQDFTIDLVDERGRSWNLQGEVQGYIPLRHRKPGHPPLQLGQAISRFTLNGGPSFLGLSEYFDAEGSVQKLSSFPAGLRHAE